MTTFIIEIVFDLCNEGQMFVITNDQITLRRIHSTLTNHLREASPICIKPWTKPRHMAKH